MQSKLGVPLDLLNIIQGALILFYSIKYFHENKEKIQKHLKKANPAKKEEQQNA